MGKNKDFDVDGFAHRLLRLRIEAGLTQAELGATAKIGASAVAHYEGGNRQPMLQTAAALADALGVSVDDLARGTGVVRIPLPVLEAYESLTRRQRALVGDLIRGLAGGGR